MGACRGWPLAKGFLTTDRARNRFQLQVEVLSDSIDRPVDRPSGSSNGRSGFMWCGIATYRSFAVLGIYRRFPVITAAAVIMRHVPGRYPKANIERS